MSPLSYTAAGLSVSAACCRKSFREYCVEDAEPAPPWSWPRRRRPSGRDVQPGVSQKFRI